MQNKKLAIHCKIALRWMPQNITNEKSALYNLQFDDLMQFSQKFYS